MLFETNIRDLLRLLPKYRTRQAKAEMRELLSQKRRLLTPEQKEEASARVIERLEELECFRKAKTLLIYYPIHNELDLLPLVKKYKHEKTILFPVTHRKSIDACPYRGNALMKRGKFNIPEPQTEPYTGNIDLILIPGVAFDGKCNRLGRGGGYYDRYLQMYKEAVTVGYAFEEQLFDAIPSEAHDRRLDFVVTQKECYEAECRPN